MINFLCFLIKFAAAYFPVSKMLKSRFRKIVQKIPSSVDFHGAANNSAWQRVFQSVFVDFVKCKIHFPNQCTVGACETLYFEIQFLNLQCSSEEIKLIKSRLAMERHLDFKKQTKAADRGVL